MSHSQWTILKDGKEYAIPYDVEVAGAQAVEDYMAAAETKDQEAERLFGAPQKAQE